MQIRRDFLSLLLYNEIAFKAFLNITLVFTLMRYYAKGENITTDMPLKICKALNCDITDIMEMEIELE